MLNKSPIFLNCFSRGGSNIFWNMFLTHPDLCSPIKETLEIFQCSFRHPRPEGYLVALLSKQLRLFDQWNLEARKPVSKLTHVIIDRTLYRWKLKTLHDSAMRYKYENEVYTLQEVENARLVAKNNNGLAFLSDLFAEMYPDAIFFALIRDPCALYESHKRRKITKSIEHFTNFYRKITERMLRDRSRFNNYHIVRFEDLLADPLRSIRELYAIAGLDIGKVKKLRFKSKPHFQPNGQHTTGRFADGHFWFEPETVFDILDSGINEYHIRRLDAVEKKLLIRLARKTFQSLGYEYTG